MKRDNLKLFKKKTSIIIVSLSIFRPAFTTRKNPIPNMEKHNSLQWLATKFSKQEFRVWHITKCFCTRFRRASPLHKKHSDMSNSDLRDKMDGLMPCGKMDAVYPEPLSRYNRCMAQLSVRKISDSMSGGREKEAGRTDFSNFLCAKTCCRIFCRRADGID